MTILLRSILSLVTVVEACQAHYHKSGDTTTERYHELLDKIEKELNSNDYGQRKRLAPSGCLALTFTELHNKLMYSNNAFMAQPNALLLTPNLKWYGPNLIKYRKIIDKLQQDISTITDQNLVLKIKNLIASRLNLATSISHVGRTTSLGCYKEGEIDRQSKAHVLCGYCKQTRKLSTDKFPNELNEVVCYCPDERILKHCPCLARSGKCIQRYETVKVLKNTGHCIEKNGQKVEEWIVSEEQIGTSCECQMEHTTLLENMFGYNKNHATKKPKSN